MKNTQDVIIRSNDGTLTVDDATVNGGSVTHYGSLDKAEIKTNMNCFHTHGTIQYMDLKDGKALSQAVVFR